MSKTNVIILAVVLSGVALALAFRFISVDPVVVEAEVSSPTTAKTPKLVEFGSDKCKSCQAMMPILDELRRAHKGALTVEFVDVWKDEEEAKKHNIQTIPTQVFFDADGKEIYRHKGFFTAEKIRARWAALGYPLEVATP